VITVGGCYGVPHEFFCYFFVVADWRAYGYVQGYSFVGSCALVFDTWELLLEPPLTIGYVSLLYGLYDILASDMSYLIPQRISPYSKVFIAIYTLSPGRYGYFCSGECFFIACTMTKALFKHRQILSK
jgi:hypothetical protein